MRQKVLFLYESTYIQQCCYVFSLRKAFVWHGRALNTTLFMCIDKTLIHTIRRNLINDPIYCLGLATEAIYVFKNVNDGRIRLFSIQ